MFTQKLVGNLPFKGRYALPLVNAGLENGSCGHGELEHQNFLRQQLTYSNLKECKND